MAPGSTWLTFRDSFPDATDTDYPDIRLPAGKILRAVWTSAAGLSQSPVRVYVSVERIAYGAVRLLQGYVAGDPTWSFGDGLAWHGELPLAAPDAPVLNWRVHNRTGAAALLTLVVVLTDD